MNRASGAYLTLSETIQKNNASGQNGLQTVSRARARCVARVTSRTVQRHEKQAIRDVARAQAHSASVRRDCKRRRLIEHSFADAANNHHFKRARWRRLWRQRIQDYLIAAIQNVRILLAHQNPKQIAAAVMTLPERVTGLQPSFTC